MLKSIEIQYFKKFEHVRFEFSSGVTHIRGANEAGKSSLIDAFLYALFGVRYLPYKMDALIHQWAPANKKKLKVVVEWGDYTISRGASGAELRRRGDLVVTGANEVTGAVLNILGIAAQAVRSVLVAEQGGLRGVLEQSTAAASLIEEMAGFQLLDDLVQHVSESTQTGGEAYLQETLQSQEQALAELTAQIEEAANLTQDIEATTAQKQSIEQALVQTEAELREQELANARAEAHNRTQATLRQRLRQAEQSLQEVRTKEAGLPDLSVVPSLRKAIETCDNIISAWIMQDRVRDLAWKGEAYWDDSPEALEVEIGKVADDYQQCRDRAIRLGAELAALPSQVTDDTCPLVGGTCGSPEKLLEHNTRVAEQTARLTTAMEREEKQAQALYDYLRTLQDIRDHQKRIENWPSLDEPEIEVDKQAVPWTVRWAGGTPAMSRQEAEREQYRLSGRLTELTWQAQKCEEERQRIEQQRAKLEHEVEMLQGQIQDDLPVADLSGLQSRVRTLREQRQALQEQVQALLAKQGELRALQQERERLQVETARLRTELQQRRDSAAYLKALRQARYKTLDYVWGLVLAGVSEYFSEMRGRSSVVTRQDGAFLVDGAPYSVLSGSTKDILGLALRLTAQQVFYPALGLLILDEPAAGCDAARTMEMMAALKASRFPQILVVTHSTVDEAVADAVLSLA